MQAYLGDIAGWAPDHRNKASLATKRVVMFWLVGGLAFSL